MSTLGAGLRDRIRTQLYALLVVALTGVALPALAADPQVASFNDAPDPVPAGGNVTYSIRVDNNGADSSLGTLLMMPVPAGATFVSAAPAAANCVFTAPNVVCNLGSVAPGGSDVRDIDIVLRALGPGPASLNLTATVSASNDTNVANNSQSQTTTVTNGADLTLAKTDSPDPVVGGSSITYTLAAGNLGPNASAGIRIVDNLPPSTTFVSAAGTGWTCANAAGVVTCTRAGPHAVGAAIPPVTIVATVTASGGAITNSATLDPFVVGGVPVIADPITANNTATADTAVLPGADVRIAQKSVTSAVPATAGTNVTFQIQPRNNGPATAINAIVTDVLPVNWIFVSASGPNWPCSVAGQTITCTRASFPLGAVDNITVVATAPTNAQIAPAGQTFTNTASITNSVTDPVASNNSGSVNVQVLRDGADVRVTKTKTPNPVAQASPLTSTLTLFNNGPRIATGPLRIVDFLPVGETFVSANGTGWTCVQAGRTITCTHPNAAGVTVGASLPAVTIVTTATANGTLTNSACTGSSVPAGSGGTPSPPAEGDLNTTNDCVSASSSSTTLRPDLNITKVTSTPTGGDKIVSATEASVTYTLVATNTTALPATDTATGVRIVDTVPGFINGRTPAPTVTAIVSGGSTATFNCTSSNATVTCAQTGGVLAAGGTVTVAITVQRPLNNGAFTNTATVSNTVQGDPDPGDNSASDTVTIDPIADVQMTGKTVTPNPVVAGQNATYVLSYRNNGPSIATNVVVTDAIAFAPGDTGFTVVSIAATGGATCSIAAGAVLTPISNTFTCTKASMANAETQSITLVVRPNFQPGNPPRAIANTASLTTSTPESTTGGNGGNNSATATLNVSAAALDLLVNKTDLVDPVPFSGTTIISYRVRVTNNGPSFGTNVSVAESMQAPAGKRIRYICDVTTYGGTTCRAPTTCSLAPNTTSAIGGALAFTCQVPPGTATTGPAVGTLVAAQTKDVFLRFQVLDAPAANGDVYVNSATVSANETDSFPANNATSEPTTVRQLIDLRATKTSSAPTVTLNQPFTWTVTVTNAGPANSLQTVVTDTLPAGFQLTGAVTWTKTSPAGSGSCVVTLPTVTCTMGPLNNAGVATISVPSRFTAFPVGGTATNSAVIDSNPATTGAIDSNVANNTATNVVTVTRSALSGTVFRDRDGNGQPGGVLEGGIGGVALALTGTDAYGNAIALSTTTAAAGTYSFTDLPPSNAGGYTITETQPALYTNGVNPPVGTADSLGGVRPTIAQVGYGTVISAIPVGGNVNGVNYNYAEVLRPSIDGTVYRDNNNNGVQNAGETGIAGATVQLYRTSNNALVGTTTTDANGAYQFANLDPVSYYILEPQPTGFLDGTATPGLIGGAACATCTVSSTYNPANEAATITRINGVDVSIGDSATGMNFGELVPSTLSGSVFVDFNSDGARNAGEPGIANVGVALTGTDDRGNAVSSPTTTDASGNYTVGSLRPSSAAGYTLTETQPAGFTNGPNPPVGSADSLGGTRPAAGVGFGLVVSAIPVAPNQNGINYTYAELGGTTVSGFVYIDRNRDGALQGTDTGRIAGVTIQLVDPGSGTVIATAVTDATGNYVFGAAPVGNYQIVEQQPPGYGSSTPNTINATIPAGGLAGQNFGDTASTILGVVFVDGNNNGTQQGGESGIGAVSIELLDATTSAVIATTATDGAGAYRFDDLRAASYTVREPTQPPGTLNGITTAGSTGGTATAVGVLPSAIASITLPIAVDSTANNFAEITASALTGSVYNDVNNNGVRDVGEAGYAGQTIVLSGTNDLGQPVNTTVTTDATGNYTFAGLRPGSYAIAQPNAPPGTLNGRTTAGSAGGTATPVTTTPSQISGIALAPGNTASGYSFGELVPASIAGSVYNDLNNNGARDGGEPGFPGQAITLTGTNDAGQAINLAATTDASGNFSFAGQRPGTYTLTQPAQPAGTQNGITTAGSSGGTATAVAMTPSAISGIVLTQGAASIGNLFGEIASGSIAGSIYVDVNNNGVRDVGETGIAGQTVNLAGTNVLAIAVTASAITDASGNYQFLTLLGGTYSITQPAQPISTLSGITTAGSGGGTVTPPATMPSVIANITLPASGAVVGNNFGEIPAAQIAGAVYNDLNNNGVRDPGEGGFAGVALTLTGTNDLGQAVSQSVATDATGAYAFIALRPGTYSITEPTQPPGSTNGITTPGSAGGTATPAATTPSAITGIALGTGVASTGNNFGEVANSPNVVVAKQAVGAFATGNDAQYRITVANIGQVATSGTITVQDRLPVGVSLGALPAGTGWTCTGARGDAAFSCTSTITIPAGVISPATIEVPVIVAASALGGAASAVLSNAVIVAGGGELAAYAPSATELANFATTPAALPTCAPSTAPAQNACRAATTVQQAANLGGTVWFDSGTINRQLDPGDQRLAGWTIEIVDAESPTIGVVRTVQSGSDGTWRVTDLFPNRNYLVRFREPNSGVYWGLPVSGNTGTPPVPCVTSNPGNTQRSSCVETIDATQLRVVLLAGDNLLQQSLPVDPAGVVYDSVTRQPVPGSVVTLAPVGTCAGYNPATHIANSQLGGFTIAGSAVSMTVGAEGAYQFLFTTTAPPNCQFGLTVAPPPSHTFISQLIAPQPNSLATPPAPGSLNVQPQATPPAIGQSTTYYLTLSAGSGTQNVLNNHIPVDPRSLTGIVIVKTGSTQIVELGDSLQYTIRIRNTTAVALGAAFVDDALPAGFRFIPGTAFVTRSGARAAIADPTGSPGPNLTFAVGTLPGSDEIVLTYRVRVGVGAAEGTGINTAQAKPATTTNCAATPQQCSNTSQFQVRVQGGVFTTDACIAGKVFVDCNGNQVQDVGEFGIPGVRLWLQDGTYFITDSEGKYSYCGIRPVLHVMKVDRATLPVGSRLTESSNRNVGDPGSLLLEIKKGELHRADFIEGTCSAPVVEQVKTRRTQGEVTGPGTETQPASQPNSRPGGPLQFRSKPAGAAAQGNGTNTKEAPSAPR